MISDLTCQAKILIVEDELPNVRLLEKILEREGYTNVSTTTDSRHALPMFIDNQPDLVLLDLHMPHQTGYEVMESITALPTSKTFVPIIVLTADITSEAKRRTLACGASDLVSKPFDNVEVALRVKNALTLRFLQLRLESQNQILDERVRERTEMLQASVVELRAAQGQIVQQERLRALGMMATGIAHDFNNVLSLILGYSELLLKEKGPSSPDTKATRYLQTVIGAAQDGAQMVNRLTQFQRPLSENDLHQAIPLVRLVHQAVDLTMPKWKGQMRAKGIAIEVVTDLEEACDLSGDSAEIREMLTNLIFNAVDALPNGGTITIRTRQENGETLLEVEDTGTGMTDDIRERCLEPFFTTKGENGSGLGLAMIYGIVQRHHGTLDINTQLNVGTTFQIRLPCHGTTTVNDDVVVETSCEPLDILVVDDQPVLREIMIEYLHGDCHRVVAAEDGDEALAKFQAGKFDLVITDQSMPGMNGEKLAEALRKIRSDIPILLLTGFAANGISSSPSPAIDAVIGKPVNLTTLRHAIAKATSGRADAEVGAQNKTHIPGSGILRRPSASSFLGFGLPRAS